MKLEADVRSLIADLRRTLAGSSEGRGALSAEATSASHLAGGTGPLSTPEGSVTRDSGRPSLEPTGATISGSGRGVEGHAANARYASLYGARRARARGGHDAVLPLSSRDEPGRPLPESNCDDWHDYYTARMARALRKQAQRTAAYKRKLWREAGAAREERRRGRTFGPAAEDEDVFRGFRGGEK